MMAIAEVRELNIGHFLIGEAVLSACPRLAGCARPWTQRDHRGRRGPVHTPDPDLAGPVRDRFKQRCFTDIERACLTGSRTRPRSYASGSRLQACAKARAQVCGRRLLARHGV
jgi:hypothetical protein